MATPLSIIESSAGVETSLPLPPTLEEFKKKVGNYYERDKALIISQLFTQLPRDSTSEDIVNLIFESSSPMKRLLIDAFLEKCPSIVLSSLNRTRLAIISDSEHVLTNEVLASLDDPEKRVCYDLAHLCNHPYIYQVSPVPISSTAYTINLLWINLNPQSRTENVAEHIFGEGKDPAENAPEIGDPHRLRDLEAREGSLEEGAELEHWQAIKKSFMYRVSKWADVHPGARIHIWYDSALVTAQAQQNTFVTMQAIARSRGADLRLRDIRHLPNIPPEVRKSLHPATPVYYRVDAAKALITDHMVTSADEEAPYCVVTDVDVMPMNGAHLFDQRTVTYLDKYGYVFNRIGFAYFENNFSIFDRRHPLPVEAHRKKVIDRIEANITELRKHPVGVCIRYEYIMGSQFVYNRYSRFRRDAGEDDDLLCNSVEQPRKPVQSPPSQFNWGGNFKESDHQRESFRFIGDSDIPYTRNGRNYGRGESHIPTLADWRAEPLPKDA